MTRSPARSTSAPSGFARSFRKFSASESSTAGPTMRICSSNGLCPPCVKLAADQGNAKAQVNLAWMYDNGLGGLSKDEREATRLYKLAADQGEATAQNNLGVNYRDGKGGLSMDRREAARLFKLAADQGNEAAKAALSRLHH
jgi:Sel1 repeat